MVLARRKVREGANGIHDPSPPVDRKLSSGSEAPENRNRARRAHAKGKGNRVVRSREGRGGILITGSHMNPKHARFERGF